MFLKGRNYFSKYLQTRIYYKYFNRKVVTIIINTIIKIKINFIINLILNKRQQISKSMIIISISIPIKHIKKL
jgi:hypothetical protein